MSTVLLDTTAANLLHPKRKKDPRRTLYEPHMKGQILALSFQTVAELLAWAEKNNWGDKQRQGLDAFLRLVGAGIVTCYNRWALICPIYARSIVG